MHSKEEMIQSEKESQKSARMDSTATIYDHELDHENKTAHRKEREGDIKHEVPANEEEEGSSGERGSVCRKYAQRVHFAASKINTFACNLISFDHRKLCNALGISGCVYMTPELQLTPTLNFKPA